MNKKRHAREKKKIARWAGKRSFRSRMTDFGLGLAAVGVAAMSSYFPYYVYNNANEFGPPTMTFTGRAALVGEENEEVVDKIIVSSLRRPLFQDKQQAIDPVVTGSVRSVLPGPPKKQAGIVQERERIGPTPLSGSQTDLQLVFAARGRALIRDGDDLLPVAVGSRLPDGSTVKSVTKPNNSWQLLTSTNRVLELSN